MKRYFDPKMLWRAGLGWMILASIGQLQDTWRHGGSGTVSYEDSGERVDEQQFKRHNYPTGGFGLLLGLGGWVLVVRSLSGRE
jgi:hypothetical protein